MADHIRIPAAAVEDMVKAIVSTCDYDAGKQLDPETAEEPEFADQMLEELVRVVHSFGD